MLWAGLPLERFMGVIDHSLIPLFLDDKYIFFVDDVF